MSGVKHGILGRLSSVRDDSLKRVDDVQNSITNTIDTGFEALGGGSKLEDCFLQVWRIQMISYEIIRQCTLHIAGCVLPHPR